jgi:hypothetical protein
LIRIICVLFLATTFWAVDNIVVRRLVIVVTVHLVGEQVSNRTLIITCNKNTMSRSSWFCIKVVCGLSWLKTTLSSMTWIDASVAHANWESYWS